MLAKLARDAGDALITYMPVCGLCSIEDDPFHLLCDPHPHPMSEPAESDPCGNQRSF
jgi:hypothetical protein